jgi:hypothetical protein
MTTSTAQRINNAACHLYFYMEGLAGCVQTDYVRIVQSVSVAQIQTAGDVVEAMNHAALAEGHGTITCVIEGSAVPRLKAFADAQVV